MNKRSGPVKIMVTCGARIPSVELGLIIPLKELEENNLCEFKYKNEMYLSLGDIAWCDILFVVRGGSFQSLWAVEKAKKLGRLVLGYWDDDLMNIPAFSLSYNYHSDSRLKKNIRILFDLTDAFFSPSTKLANKLSSIHKKTVKILPPPLGSEKFCTLIQNRSNIATIGFAGSRDHGVISHLLLAPVLISLDKKSFNFKVHIIGPKPDFIGKLHAETIYTRHIDKYSDYIEYASNLQWDIGLAPQVDCEFTTYKFYNKLLEYSYIGCAGIYSKLEPYIGVIEDGITGLLVENEVEAWEEAIRKLLKDKEMRYKIASNAREYVMYHHNRKIIAQEYSRILGPFLDYQAPKITKSYAFSVTFIGTLKSTSKYAIEYLKMYGIRKFVPAGFKYITFLLKRAFKII